MTTLIYRPYLTLHTKKENLTDEKKKKRETLWDIFPWPCVGQFRFLSLSLSETSSYGHILSSLAPSTTPPKTEINSQTSHISDENTNLHVKDDNDNDENNSSSNSNSNSNPKTRKKTKTLDITKEKGVRDEEKQKNKILDIGCLLAPSLRKLARDGADPTSLYGLEIEPRFFQVGYDLFGDRSIIPEENFVCGDIFNLFRDDGDNNNLVREKEKEKEKEKGEERLYQTFKTINLSMILHIFPLALQIEMCAILATKLLRQERGVMVVGQCVGDLRGREVLIASSTGMGMSFSVSEEDTSSSFNNITSSETTASSGVENDGASSGNNANDGAGDGGCGGMGQEEKEKGKEEDEREEEEKEKEKENVKKKKKIFKHNPETFSQMWEEVGNLTGSKWEVTHCVLDFFGDDHDAPEAGSTDYSSSSGANYIYHDSNNDDSNNNNNGEEDGAGVGYWDGDGELTRDGIRKKGSEIDGVGDGDGGGVTGGTDRTRGRTGKRKGREWDEDTTRRLRFEVVRVE